MTARSAAWLKNNFMERDPYDYNVDLVDTMGTWEETLTIGEDGDGDDVQFYGDTSGCYFLWDADTNSLLIPGTAGRLQIGGFTGAAAGTGSVVSASYTAPFKVFADDGNAAIGSGSLVRAGWFRNLQVYTGGNREQEAAGVQGSIVSVAGTNRHNMCGVLGSYEARTSLTVDGQAAATDTWAQAAVIGRVGVGSGITTINTNGVLAGVAAMSNTASFAANNGVYAAYYAGAWSGAADWAYGVYLEGGKFTTGVAIGECTTGITIGTSTTGISITGATGYALDIQTSGQLRMGIQGTGIPTATATPFAMEIHSETGSALTAGTTGLSCGIRSRYEISVAQPNQISLTAVEGRLRVKANIADGCHSAVSGTIEGDASITYSGTATTQRNAGNFCVELGATSTLSAGWITGVTIDSSSNGSLSTASITYAGLRIKKATGALAWEYGIILDDSAATTGIAIGTCTTGIDITGACSTAGINFTAANLNCIKSVYNISSQLGQYVQGIKIEHTRSADIQPSTGGWWGIQCVLNAGTGYTALDQPAYVIHGVFKGDATDPGTDCVNVARFETQSSGKVEDVMFVSANSGSTVEGDVARINTHVAPTRSILAVQNGAASCPKGIIVDIDATMTTGIEFNTGAAITNLFSVTAAANTSYFLIADAEAGCFPNYASAGSAIANIKIKIGSTDGYIKVYDAA